MSVLSCRPAVGADLPYIKALNEELLPDNYDWHIWWHVQQVGSLYVALDHQRVIGYIVATWDSWPMEGPYVFSIAVLPKYRRRGIGKQLLEHIWDHPKRQGRPLSLHCRISNEAAQALYRSYGFIEIERLKDNYPVGPDQREDGLLLRRIEKPAVPELEA
jgi:ribosomal-protein-alanine N-acetyltransferase